MKKPIRKIPSRSKKTLKTKNKKIVTKKKVALKIKKPLKQKVIKTKPQSTFSSISQNISNGKMKVEAAKFETAHYESDKRKHRREISLPTAYGDHKIVALVRDPWWLYTYWEIKPEKESEIRRQMDNEKAEYECHALRVYDITKIKNFNGNNANYYFDIRISNIAQNWYIDVAKPNCSWCIDIGLLAKNGKFFALARSNYVHTPRFGMSEVLDEEWMCPEEDYWQLFGLSGGFSTGKSSAGMKETFKKYLEEWMSSKAESSFSSFILAKKDK